MIEFVAGSGSTLELYESETLLTTYIMYGTLLTKLTTISYFTVHILYSINLPHQLLNMILNPQFP
jgi:hypothetical protein